jgi:hypothetical protein
MAKLQHKNSHRAQAAELKATAVLETNETAQTATQGLKQQLRRFRDGGIRDAQ